MAPFFRRRSFSSAVKVRGDLLQRYISLGLLISLWINILLFRWVLDGNTVRETGNAPPIAFLRRKDPGREVHASSIRRGVRPSPTWRDGVDTSSSVGTPPQALMIIASYPSSDMKTAAIWSQLECFARDFDKIIISAPHASQSIVTRLLEEVTARMPDVARRLEAQYYVNDRYDAGLWCDALIQGRNLLPLPSTAQNTLHLGRRSPAFVGGSSRYDRFLLINDSMMAVEPTNMFLEALAANNASLVSLNYWGDKNSVHQNSTDLEKYWLESPLRAFSLEGVQIYADNICPSQRIEWRKHCKHMWTSMYGAGNEYRKKRCIVEKTEMNVVDHYRLDKVHGLFPGPDGESHWNDQMGFQERGQWGKNFTYWMSLRDRSFPVLKNSDEVMFETAIVERRQDLERCTSKMAK